MVFMYLMAKGSKTPKMVLVEATFSARLVYSARFAGIVLLWAFRP